MELLAYWQIIRKRLLLIVAIAAIATLAAAFVVSRQVPVYRTTTTLFLNPAATNPLLPLQATQTMQATANTYIELMRTRSFATMVAEQSGLALSADDVLEALTAQYVADTQFFRIVATHADPNAAQVIASTAAETLIAQNAARRQAAQAQLQSQLNQDPELQQLIELRDSLRDELDLYNQRVENTREQVEAMEARAPSERNDQRLAELRGDLVALQQVRAATLNSFSQVQSSLVEGGRTSANTPTDTAVVVDPAPLPDEPLPLNMLRNLLLALALGLAAGVGLAFGLEYIDYTVRAPDALELVYGAPVLGVIGIVGTRRKTEGGKTGGGGKAGGGGGGNPSYSLTLSDPRSAAAESIRSLRTSVQVAGLSRPLRSLLVTSAGPGEGKTFIATNLAVSMAQYGQSVILVDLDLRRPNLHNVCGLRRDPGFTNLVFGREAELLAAMRPRVLALAEQLRERMSGAGQVLIAAEQGGPQFSRAGVERLLRRAEAEGGELAAHAAELRAQIERGDDPSAYLRPHLLPNLMIMTAGALPPHPSELLGSSRTAQIMERLSAYADVVIYDSPPAGLVTDAVLLAPRVDAVVQVVRAGHTRIDLIRRTQMTLQQAGATLIGPVLNQVKLSEMGSYSYYYQYGYDEHGQGRRGGRGERSGSAPAEHPERNGHG
jgi:Mrp family chromosome partitioning ATPase/capsular polysaccharide biosynthesis protein